MGYTREIAEEVLGDYDDFIGGIYAQNRISFLSYKFLLPEKEWLKSQDRAIVYRTGKTSGYGINNSGEWDKSEDWSFISFPEAWQQATKEEVKESLIDFVRKQGYKNGNYKCLFSPGYTCEVNEDVFHIDDNNFDIWHGEEDGEHNLLFDSTTGEWAKIIEDENKELKEQIEKVEKQLNELKARL